MDFRKGFSLKPHVISDNGQVSFTDGVNGFLPANQETCEAYGYRYDTATGSCMAFTNNFLLRQNFENTTNSKLGTENTTEIGVNYTKMIGQNNSIASNCKNNLIVGRDNAINKDINNASVLGIGGTATRQSEFVIGGGNNLITTTVGELTTSVQPIRQMSIVELAGATVDNTATTLTVNGDGSSYINVRNNSIVGYEIYLTRLETGGTSGTAGNYSYRNMKGVVQIDDTYNMAFVVGFTRNIGKIGVNGSFSMVDTSTTDVKSISVSVIGSNNINNAWSAVVYIHEIALTKTTF
jgi:hypothetical protein